MAFNTSQAIEHRILRCRPGDADKYRSVHNALAGVVSPAEEIELIARHYSAPSRLSLWQRIRQSWKALAG